MIDCKGWQNIQCTCPTCQQFKKRCEEQEKKEMKMRNVNNKYQWAEPNSGSDREFLEWLWQRLHSVFGERDNNEYMQRLDKIIQETPGASSANRPAFEIKSEEYCVNIKIWANGRVEGITGSIINRIPQLIAEAKQK